MKESEEGENPGIINCLYQKVSETQYEGAWHVDQHHSFSAVQIGPRLFKGVRGPIKEYRIWGPLGVGVGQSLEALRAYGCGICYTDY